MNANQHNAMDIKCGKLSLLKWLMIQNMISDER